jgi:hypothetical protein
VAPGQSIAQRLPGIRQQARDQHVGPLAELGVDRLARKAKAKPGKGLLPGEDVPIVAVHQRAVDVEEDSFLDHVPSPAKRPLERGAACSRLRLARRP